MTTPDSNKIHIVSGNISLDKSLAKRFPNAHFYSSISNAAEEFEKNPPQLVIVEIEAKPHRSIEYIRYIMQVNPAIIIVIGSSQQKSIHFTLMALESGASGFIIKTENSDHEDLADKIYNNFLSCRQLNIDAVNNILNFKKPDIIKRVFPEKKVITIGASAGSLLSFSNLIKSLPDEMPPIMSVIHLPAVYTKVFADRLNKLSSLHVKEAGEETLKNGYVYIAPGDFHLYIEEMAGEYILRTKQSEFVSDSRPSIDVMMYSVAENFGPNAVGILLAGLSNDGISGLRTIRTIGGKTICQNEDSALCYNIIKLTKEIKAVEKYLDIKDIPGEILSYFS